MSGLDAPAQAPFGEPRSGSAPEIAAGKIRKLRKAAASANSPCFIHSSWRTGKTWFSLLFRHFPETMCFYEPFNEALATLTTTEAVQLGAQSWESGHPTSVSYWREYIGLIRKSGGVRLFRPEMPYDWFIPIGGLRGELRASELKYLAFLIRSAQRRRQIPVLAFSRSLGRIHPIKEQFPGTHLLITRSLWAQWASYSHHRQIGNPYFVHTIFQVIENPDPFFEHLRDFYLGSRSPEGAGNSMLAASSRGRRTDAILASLSESDLFTIFAAVHMYLYLQARPAADLIIDSTKLTRDYGYRQSTTRELREMTGLQLSLADAKESFRFTTVDDSVMNRAHIERHVRVAAGMLQEWQENKGLLKFAEQLLDGIYAEISRNSYLEPARRQFNALAKEQERLQAVVGERDNAVAAAEARAAGAEASLAELQHELAAQSERLADLVCERDERVAALSQVEAEAAGLRARIGERSAAAAAAEARAGAAEASLAEIQHELAAQGERFEDLEREGRERVAALSQVEAEAAGLRAGIGERDAAAAAAEARASAAEAGFAEARTEIARLRADLDQAETEIRQRGAAEFALRGGLESLRRASNRLERERDERVGELEALQVEVKAERAAAVGAHGQICCLEVRLAEARQESEARLAQGRQELEARQESEARLAEAEQEIEAGRGQLATAAQEKAEHGSAIGALKGEIAALQRDFTATKQIGHELMTASTAEFVAPEKPSQGGNVRSAMRGFGRAMKTGAVARGDRARDAKQWQLAARHYRKALARDPHDAPCWVQYGHALKESGRLPEAEAAYRRSLACAPSVADTHLQLGHVLKLQGRTTTAQAAYLRAFALDPDMAAASEELAGLGWLPMHLAQLHGLSANPDIVQLRSLRDAADAARDRRDWPEAAKLYQEFVTADPSDFDITVQLGHARKEMGDLDRAAQAYYRALEVDPLDDDLHLQIGHLEKLRRDFALAAAHYQRAAQINPANAAARREAAALGDRVHELRPGAAGPTGSGGPARGGSNAQDANDLRFLDARAGEIYQQLLTAMA